MDLFQNIKRFGLIVYSIERRDKVKDLGLSGTIKIAQISDDKFNSSQTLLRRLAAARSNRLRREVYPGKPAVRVHQPQKR